MKVFALSILLFFNLQNSAQAWLGVQVPEDHNVIKSFGSSEKEEIEKEVIDIFVWNIYKAKKKNWKDQFRGQVSNYDFFLLQEMVTNPLIKSVFTDTRSVNFTTATSFIYKKNLQRTGVATGSKYLPAAQSFLRSQNREPILLTPKITLFTKYPIKGTDKELLVVNIHAINFVSSTTLHSQLKDAADVIKEHNGPSIFAGDFNTWTQTKINNLNAVMKKLGFNKVNFSNPRSKFINTSKPVF